MMMSSRAPFCLALGLAVWLVLGAWVCADDNPIGTSQASEAALIGTLYDLKQTQDRKPVAMDPGLYDYVLARFITHGWDESILNKYYRIMHPFYTTQVFIPMLGDKVAPTVFGVDDRIKDGYWMIHYKGTVAPPADGRYRFVGYAHATMLVAIDGKLVLNGCRFNLAQADPAITLRSVQDGHDPQAGAKAGDFRLTYGPWIDLKHSESVDIDILFGNRVAAELCAFLLVQKSGDTYELDNKGFPILPIFQVAPYNGPPLLQEKYSTRCTVNSLIWKSLQ